MLGQAQLVLEERGGAGAVGPVAGGQVAGSYDGGGRGRPA